MLIDPILFSLHFCLVFRLEILCHRKQIKRKKRKKTEENLKVQSYLLDDVPFQETKHTEMHDANL